MKEPPRIGPSVTRPALARALLDRRAAFIIDAELGASAASPTPT